MRKVYVVLVVLQKKSSMKSIGNREKRNFVLFVTDSGRTMALMM